MVPVDPESTSVEIMTDSELGSEDRMRLTFYTSFGYIAGGFNVFFSSIPQYWIQYCSSSKTNFPTDLPVARDKIWRITLTKTFGIRLQIHCNNVEILNILLSDTTCGRRGWSTYWNRKIEKIRPDPFDSASDYYRLSNPGKHDLLLCLFIYLFIYIFNRLFIHSFIHISFIRLLTCKNPKTCV